MFLGGWFPVFVIIISEWLATSLWFASNSVINEIAIAWKSEASTGAALNIAVQVGFVSGTLLIVFCRLADHLRASRLFAASALLGAIANYCFAAFAVDVQTGQLWRFFTGFALAGVYPIGMKLVVGWGWKRPGIALSWLVGALTLGTATPHLIAALAIQFQWSSVVKCASVLAVTAGLFVYLLGDGPARVEQTVALQKQSTTTIHRKMLTRVAVGYFGHMWELYAFWGMVPFLIQSVSLNLSATYRSFAAFGIIGSGVMGCLLGGYFSERCSSLFVARTSLVISGAMCFLFPLCVSAGYGALAMGCLVLWGFFVIADSPQFSALTTKYVSNRHLGSVLTAQNSLGFMLTIGSIHLTQLFRDNLFALCWLLIPGPVIGLIALVWGWSKDEAIVP